MIYLQTRCYLWDVSFHVSIIPQIVNNLMLIFMSRKKPRRRRRRSECIRMRYNNLTSYRIFIYCRMRCVQIFMSINYVLHSQFVLSANLIKVRWSFECIKHYVELCSASYTKNRLNKQKKFLAVHVEAFAVTIFFLLLQKRSERYWCRPQPVKERFGNDED